MSRPSSSTLAAIAAFVFARCGAQRSQYQRDISGQSAAVETRTFCTCVYIAGMSGSANACGELVATNVCTVEPSASRVTLVAMLPSGWRIAMRRSGLPAGAVTS